MPKDTKGLSSAEAKKRLEKYGQNVLPERPPPSNLSILVSQLKSPLVYILLVAGVVTIFLREYSDTTIIFIAVFINTVLGFFQERRASQALYALKKLIHPKAMVVRDGKGKKIDVEDVVPGDLVILGQGDKIPADGKLVFANRFFADEAILTGESVPVAKVVDKKVFMGTVVSGGRARLIVGLTGEKTEIGKIALSIQEPDENTPLKKQLVAFSKQLTILVLVLTMFIFIIGLLTSMEPSEIFTTSVALAVSAIPEGLLVGLTVVLAIGMQRILKRKGLVRNLVSAETLGGVTTICVDKTGTLTAGKMQVVSVTGDERKLAKQAIIANDFDDPITIAAFNWAKSKITNRNSLTADRNRLDSIPFSSKDRFFASLNKGDKHNSIYVNGAPEFLLDWSDMTNDTKKEIREEIDKLTKEGKRLMGMANKKVSTSKKKLNAKDIKDGLEWVGILAFSDPVRKGVRDAFTKTKLSGINLIVITGDYSQTAVSVIRQLGIEVRDDQIITGKQLVKYSTEELSNKLKNKPEIKLFARTTPDQKLKIVEALETNGEVVAMMGDGVNDAPALRKADIGIVVGEATDVAKETADLVLLDSSFATIVQAIEEGRGIFDNLRKIILYLMSDAFEEIIAVVGSIILGVTVIIGLPLPVTAGQILWINLVSDGFPHLALTIDPKEPGIMKRKPRNPKERLVNSWMKRLILIVSLTGGLMALGLYVYFYQSTGNIELARSIAFATLGVNSLIYVFSIRTLTKPFWIENPFNNKWLNVAVLAGFAFQFMPFIFPTLRRFLKLVTLSTEQWVYVFSASILMFIMIEMMKYFFRHRLKLAT